MTATSAERANPTAWSIRASSKPSSGGVAGGIGELGLAGPVLQFLERDRHLGWVDVGTAAALEGGFFGGPTDHGDMGVFLQRQQTVVLEQDHPFSGDLLGEGMVGGCIETAALGGFAQP